MYITELINKPNNKSITVTFAYDEIRDIANGLYYLISDKKPEEFTRDKYEEIHAEAKFLFDMIKHGNIQDSTINYFSKLNKEKENAGSI